MNAVVITLVGDGGCPVMTGGWSFNCKPKNLNHHSLQLEEYMKKFLLEVSKYEQSGKIDKRRQLKRKVG